MFKAHSDGLRLIHAAVADSSCGKLEKSYLSVEMKLSAVTVNGKFSLSE